jgi:hypothetical protein
VGEGVVELEEGIHAFMETGRASMDALPGCPRRCSGPTKSQTLQLPVKLAEQAGARGCADSREARPFAVNSIDALCCAVCCA